MSSYEKTFDYDLVIVGAGFSGLNALAAAIRVSPHLRIAVLEATSRVGGHWNTAYSFVRLHNRYYSIGEAHGLVGGDGTRDDVLMYATRVLDDILAREDVDVSFLWDCRFFSAQVREKKFLTIRTSNGWLTADRLINTVRYSLPRCIQKPLGVRPHDLPGLLGAQRYLVIGSGKTAIDVLCYLSRNNRTAWCTVIGGSPVAFLNREVPMSMIVCRALASMSVGGGASADPVLDRMRENGDAFYFMGQPGSWRYGYSDIREMAQAEGYVDEYLSNMHIDGYAINGDSLDVYIHGGRIIKYPADDTVLVDCRGGLTGMRAYNDDIYAFDCEERVLNIFLTDQTDTCTAYTFAGMFLSGMLQKLREYNPLPLYTGEMTMTIWLSYISSMARLRRGALTSAASRRMLGDMGVMDKLWLWWNRDKIYAGKSMLVPSDQRLTL
jgi:hypothetical protein